MAVNNTEEIARRTPLETDRSYRDRGSDIWRFDHGQISSRDIIFCNHLLQSSCKLVSKLLQNIMA